MDSSEKKQTQWYHIASLFALREHLLFKNVWYKIEYTTNSYSFDIPCRNQLPDILSLYTINPYERVSKKYYTLDTLGHEPLHEKTNNLGF